jgi:hypothetical protein
VRHSESQLAVGSRQKAGESWSNGVAEHWKTSNSKHQISGCQVSGVRKKKHKS